MRQFNCLCRRCKNTNGIHHHSQAHHQHNHLYTRGNIHVLRHKKLLLGNTLYLIWIHQNYYWDSTRGDYRGIYPQDHCTKRVYILWNSKRNVQDPAGRNTWQSATGQKIVTQGVLTIQAHTRPVEANMETGHILIGGWWLQGKINWKKTCRTLDKFHTRALSSLNRLERTMILPN